MILRWSALAAALAAAIGLPAGHAFTASATSRSSRLARPSTRASSSSLNMGPPADPSAPLTEQFGEGSRKYRRTVYTHDAWVRHRSSDRFVNNLGTLFQSGIYKQVGKEVSATVSVAAFVCLWNALVGGYQDFDGVMHDPVINAAWAAKVGIPMEAFTILSPSLGLLLVFRTNSSYKRWDEARKFWGLNINHTRDLNRMATAWYGKQTDFDGTEFFEDETRKLEPIDPAERRYLLGQVSLMTWAFVRSMKRHLSPAEEDEEDYVAEVEARMTKEQAKALVGATHRPNRALYDLSVAIEQLPMHFVRKNAINNNLSIFEDTLGGSERLLSSPVPLFYSRHTARFLATWLLLLPLGLYGQFANSWNHAMMIPATAFISVALFGIEELATQLEEPFTILPMQGFCDKIGMNCFEIVGWAGQGQEGEEEFEAEMEALPEAEEFVPLPPKADFAPVSEAEDEASALDVLANELLFPLFNPTILKDVDGSAVRGAAINGIFLTLLASVLKSGPLSVTEPGTLIEAASVGTVFAYVSITEGRAGDFARGVGSTTMDIVGELMDEKEQTKVESKSTGSEVEPASPKPHAEAPSSEVIAESLPLIQEEATAEDAKSKVNLEDAKPAIKASVEAQAPSEKMFFAEEETKPEQAGTEIDTEDISSQKEKEEVTSVEAKVPEAQPEEETSRPAMIENRARRRISLRERLERMEEGQNAAKAPVAEMPSVEEPAKVETVEAAAVEDVRPEEEMEKMTKGEPKNSADNRAKASLSLREIVSGMN